MRPLGEKYKAYCIVFADSDSIVQCAFVILKLGFVQLFFFLKIRAFL